jgi:tetratricopeptide (TPR) repeat protein
MDSGNLTAQVSPLTPPAASKKGKARPAAASGGKLAFLAKLTDTKPKKIMVFSGLGLVLLIMVMAMAGSLMGPSKPQRKAPVAQEEEPKGPTAEEVFAKAGQHIKAKEWTQAAELLAKLVAHDPSSQVYAKQSEYVTLNLKAQELLEKARQALTDKDLPSAGVRVADFLKDPKLFKDGTCQVHGDYCTAAQALARKIDVLKALPLVREARALLKDKKKKEATEKIDEALKIAPTYYAAQKVKQELGGPEPTVQPDPELDRLALDEAPADAPPTDTGAAGGTYVYSGPMPKSAKDLYQARNFSGAARELNDLATKNKGALGKQYTTYAQSMSRLQSLIASGDAAASSDTAQAMVQYKDALAADQGVGGAHQAWIKEKLAKVGKARAGALFAAGKYPAAYQMVLAAEGYGATGLDGIRDQLSRKAKEIFNQGYIAKDRDPDRAKELFRSVLSMVPGSDESAKKSQSYLSGMGGGMAAPPPPPRRADPPRYVPPPRRVDPPRRTPPTMAPAGMRPAGMRPARRRYVVGGGDEDEDE